MALRSFFPLSSARPSRARAVALVGTAGRPVAVHIVRTIIVQNRSHARPTRFAVTDRTIIVQNRCRACRPSAASAAMTIAASHCPRSVRAICRLVQCADHRPRAQAQVHARIRMNWSRSSWLMNRNCSTSIAVRVILTNYVCVSTATIALLLLFNSQRTSAILSMLCNRHRIFREKSNRHLLPAQPAPPHGSRTPPRVRPWPAALFWCA